MREVPPDGELPVDEKYLFERACGAVSASRFAYSESFIPPGLC